MTRRTFAVIADFDPHGGGNHQWSLNILCALDDYRRVQDDIDVVLFHYERYPGGHPIRDLFPKFAYVGLSKSQHLIARAIRRFSIYCPWAMPLLRPFFPLNREIRRRNAALTVFPRGGMDSPLCDIPHIFCVADIAHVYYPHFPEVRVRGSLRLRQVMLRYGAANARRVMVESQELAREMTRHYGVPPQKISVVHQVLPRLFSASILPDVGPDRQRPYLFYPAQLWAHKNHKNLLAAFAELAGEFPDLRLVLAGSRQPGSEAIFDLIRTLGLSGRVDYLGYIPDEQMPKLYRNAAALVMPTYFGPTNIPTLEAFAFGCPAVISDLPGVEEQTGDAALRFDPDNPREMTDNLRQVLTDPVLARRLVAAGRARMDQLSYENYCRQMFALFDAALISPPDRRGA
jgi:glycosyltransferase involved in cell wall biosynthesis